MLDRSLEFRTPVAEVIEAEAFGSDLLNMRLLTQALWFALLIPVHIIIILEIPAHARAADWISFKTSHFELRTTSAETEGRESLQALEKARSVMLQHVPFLQSAEQPVRIIAFASREEYSRFDLNGNSFGHYITAPTGDLIVLQDLKAEHREAIVHEYTHFLLRCAGLHLPLWLNEGLADFYSTVGDSGPDVSFGRILLPRMKAWSERQLIPLSALFQVDRHSPYYQEPEKMQQFYAESWMLVHMLTTDIRFAAVMPSLVEALGRQRVTSAAAVASVLAVSLEELQSSLLQYNPIAPNDADHNTEAVMVEHEDPLVYGLAINESAATLDGLASAQRPFASHL